MIIRIRPHSAVIAIGLLVAGCSEPPLIPPKEYPASPRVGPFHEIALPEGSSLEGHTWQIGSIDFTFQKGNHVVVRGGHLVEPMPTGAPGLYTLEGRELTLDVLGREYAGSWDGNRLVLNGKEAFYLGETAVIYPELVLDYKEPETEEPIDEEGSV